MEASLTGRLILIAEDEPLIAFARVAPGTRRARDVAHFVCSQGPILLLRRGNRIDPIQRKRTAGYWRRAPNGGERSASIWMGT
jgi:hypothetical protein